MGTDRSSVVGYVTALGSFMVKMISVILQARVISYRNKDRCVFSKFSVEFNNINRVDHKIMSTHLPP